MQILHVNKFLWESGGAEQAMFQLAALQEQHGHSVEYFAMQHEKNLPSENSEFFVPHIDYRSDSLAYKLRSLPNAIAKTVYSPQSRSQARRLLASRKIDIAHVHMIEHQISPSVLHAFRDAGVPVIHSCHDHKLVCPASHLYIEPKGEICERCVDSRAYYHLVLNRCMRGSLAVSTLASVAHYLHRWNGIYEKNVDFFCSATRFLASRLVRGGFPEDKIRIVPYGIDLSKYEPRFQPGDYVLYFGRLSREKGLPTLLEAAERLSAHRFVIVGSGPQGPELEETVQRKGLSNVSFAGFLPRLELVEYVRQAALVVLPSECHENLPIVVLEAAAFGKPIVASSVGGVPEYVADGETGMLFEPGNSEQLAAAIDRLVRDPRASETMGRRSRAKIEGICSQYYPKTQAVYEEALALRSGS